MPSPAEISRRLKAGRWIAGDVDDNGKPKQLKVEALAKRSPLRENGITANRLEEIEQLKITAPPMELEKIAAALALPHDWFEDGEAAEPITPAAARALLERLVAAVDQERSRGGEAPQSAPDGTGRPGESAEGAGA